MKKRINVLSLFDGMSCGQIALNRASVKYGKYYASEVDKYAIKVTQANYPKTIQLGDIMKVKGSDLPRIDLLLGGSPCQGFSSIGSQLNFEHSESKLFFEYVRILKELKQVNSNIKFLLENVRMRSEFSEVISEYLGVNPIKINSSLVSAQNRERFYWTNISGLTPPEDRNLFLGDVMQADAEIPEKYFLSRKMISYLENNFEDRNYKFANRYKLKGINEKAYCLLKGEGNKKKSNFLRCSKHLGVRKLTTVEMERLQTVPDNYTDHVSDTQRRNMLGNGWTVDVVAHIFKHLKY
jgi:DNA-cytosine methyltransferase